VVVALVAGCAGADVPSDAPATSDASSPTTAASASSAPSATSAPSAEPATPSPSAAATIAPDADLAALLPTTLLGRALTVQSFDGEELAPSDDQPDSLPFGLIKGGLVSTAETLGVSLSDVQAAAAYTEAYAPGLSPVIIAIRFGGADSAAIVDGAMVAIGGQAFLAGQLMRTEETVGGKPVSVLDGSSSAYFYAIGDVIFIVQTPARDEAEDLLGQLP